MKAKLLVDICATLIRPGFSFPGEELKKNVFSHFWNRYTAATRELFLFHTLIRLHLPVHNFQEHAILRRNSLLLYVYEYIYNFAEKIHRWNLIENPCMKKK